jgi:hypothetical protein
VLPAEPWTISIATNRRFAAIAVRASAGVDGIIASRNGNATVTPIPFRAVRRDKGFRLMSMVMSLILLPLT